MSVASLTPRVREALGVSSSYDAETVPAAIRRAIKRLLRDYNFPKTSRRKIYTDLVDQQQVFTLPQGYKKLLAARFYDPVENAWGDALLRREAFMLPNGDGVPRRYWIEGTKLYIDTPLSGDYTRTQLFMQYQSQLTEDNEDWMTDDFDDVLFNFTIYREATGQFRKPEIASAFAPLWAEDRQALAIYLHELEFDDLEMIMREQHWNPVDRYPVN